MRRICSQDSSAIIDELIVERLLEDAFIIFPATIVHYYLIAWMLDNASLLLNWIDNIRRMICSIL